MSGATRRKKQLSTATPQASSSSTLSLDPTELPTPGLHHGGQPCQSAAIADTAGLSNVARNRPLPEGLFNRKGGERPQNRLYSLTDVEQDSAVDLGSWAEVGNDHGLGLAEKIFLHLLVTSRLEVHIPSSQSTRKVGNANTKHRNLQLRLRDDIFPFSQRRTIWTISSTNATPSSLAVQLHDCIQHHWHKRLRAFGEAAQFHIPLENHLQHTAGSCHITPEGPRGKIWWITDNRCYTQLRTSRNVMSIDLLVLLVHLYYFKLFRKPQNHRGGRLAEIDEVCLAMALYSFKGFVLVFANLSNPSSRRFRYSYDGFDSLELHFHLRHFSPGTTPVPAEGLVFAPDRKAAKIHYFDQDDKLNKVLDLEERGLSLMLTMRPRCGTFFLFVVGDEGVPVETRGYAFDQRWRIKYTADLAAYIKEKPWERLGIDPWNSGKRAGPSHFLTSLYVLLDAWHSGWNTTLDRVDSTVRFQMSNTLERGQLDDFMFDRSGSMDLSRQYFTVLQILRIANEWIDASVSDWDQMRQGIVETFRNLEYHGVPIHDEADPMKDQLDKIKELLTRQASQLQDRINKKTEEVKSLRDGLFNATSLREAMRGMELNRAIYMFTAVTVLYTPLGFMAAFWALPILNTTTEGDNMHPSVSVLVATFVSIPIATYVVCGWLAWHNASSDAPAKKWLKNLLSKSNTNSEPREQNHLRKKQTTRPETA